MLLCCVRAMPQSSTGWFRPWELYKIWIAIKPLCCSYCRRLLASMKGLPCSAIGQGFFISAVPLSSVAWQRACLFTERWLNAYRRQTGSACRVVAILIVVVVVGVVIVVVVLAVVLVRLSRVLDLALRILSRQSQSMTLCSLGMLADRHVLSDSRLALICHSLYARAFSWLRML